MKKFFTRNLIVLLGLSITSIVCLTGTVGGAGSLPNSSINAGQIVANSATSAKNNVSNNLIVPVPSGVNQNDVLIAVIDVLYKPNITAPSGWTLIRSDINPNGNHLRQAVYYRVANNSEPSNYTWNFSLTHGAVGGMIDYSGVDTLNPVDVSSVQFYASTTNLAAPSVTTTVANDLLLGIFSTQGDHPMTLLGGMTQEYQVSYNLTVGEKLSGLEADQMHGAAGSTGTRSVTTAVASTGTAGLVALRPAPANPNNQPPVVDSVAINQTSPATNDILNATVTAHDPDGDPMTFSYQWIKNGNNIAGATNSSLNLSQSGNGNAGDNIKLQVTASDGTAQSSPLTSAPVTIVNTPPTAFVSISPGRPIPTSTVVATVTANDVDNDPLVFKYVWDINGNVVRTINNSSSFSDSLNLNNFGVSVGDVVTVTVTPNDGSQNGATATNSATVVNSVRPVGYVTEYPVTAGSIPSGITLGPDGNMWFTEESTFLVGKVTPSGVVTEYDVRATGNLGGITAGPDGNIWFTEHVDNKIGVLTTNGMLTEIPIIPSSAGLAGITTGPDGNIWFTEQGPNRVAKINPYTFAVTQYSIPTASALPHGINPGPDGNVWFVEISGNKIARVTPSGVITEFPIPTLNSNPRVIETGPDGNLWFTEFAGNKIGRITPSGVITEFVVPTASSQPVGITGVNADGNVWFTEQGAGKIGRITPSGVITEFSLPNTSAGPDKITCGPDGNVWFAERNVSKIGTMVTH